MTDIEIVLTLFPDAEVITLAQSPPYAIAIGHRQLILARGVSEEDAWNRAAAILRWNRASVPLAGREVLDDNPGDGPGKAATMVTRDD